MLIACLGASLMFGAPSYGAVQRTGGLTVLKQVKNIASTDNLHQVLKNPLPKKFHSALSFLSSSSSSSASANFGSLASSVNPRTGALSLHFPIGEFSSHGLTKTDYGLSMVYSMSGISSNNPYYISTHWSYGLPLVSGGVFALNGSEHYISSIGAQIKVNGKSFSINGKPQYPLMFRYAPILNAQISTSTTESDFQQQGYLNDLTVTLASGVCETFAPANSHEVAHPGMLVLKKITYPSGYSVQLAYTRSSATSSYYLSEVTDSLGNVLSSDVGTGGPVISSGLTWTRTLVSNSSNPVKQTVTLKGSTSSISGDSATLLQTITVGQAGGSSDALDSRSITLKHYQMSCEAGSGCQNDLISEISGPKGANAIVHYGQLPYSDANGSSYLLGVSSVCHQNVENLKNPQNGLITSFSYGSDSNNSPTWGFDQLSTACKIDENSQPLVAYSGHNYTGNGKFSLGGGNTSNGGLYYGVDDQDYSFTVASKTQAYEGGKALLSEVQSTHVYDRFQRLVNSSTLQGGHKTEVAYSYNSSVAPSLDITKNIKNNVSNTTIDSDGHPSSNTYTLSRGVLTQSQTSAAKNASTYQTSVRKTYDEYGNLLTETQEPSGVQKTITYDQVHMYAGVPSIPEVIQTATPGAGVFTTVNTVSPYTADVLMTGKQAKVKDENNLHTHSRKVLSKSKIDVKASVTTQYYGVSSSEQYFKPSATLQGIDITAWGKAPKTSQYGYPILLTTNIWGSTATKNASYAYLYGKILSYPTGSPYAHNLEVALNPGKNGVKSVADTKTFDLPQSTMIAYQYDQKPVGNLGTYSITESKESKLSNSSSALVKKITSTQYLDSASGLAIKTVGQIHTNSSQAATSSGGTGAETTMNSYDGLGRITEQKTIITPHSGKAKIVGDIQYKYPTPLVQIKTDTLTGYTQISQEILTASGSTSSAWDNAYPLASSKAKISANPNCQKLYGVEVCKLGQTQSNILGQTQQSTSYQSAGSSVTGVETSFTSGQSYDSYGRPDVQIAANKVSSARVYGKYWVDSSLNQNSYEGDLVTLHGAFQFTFTSPVSGTPIEITETSVKTGDTLASYQAPYPNANGSLMAKKVYKLCQSAGVLTINSSCLQNIVQNKAYSQKTSAVYNHLGNVISTTAASPNDVASSDSAVYVPGAQITTRTTYNLFGQPVMQSGPPSALGNDDARTIYTSYNLLGNADCMAMSEGESKDACEAK